ncbi:uncharacterized protein LOC121425284 [Lytechinus variegatus]|uniref:uncharacterized protein LOC121425284 n=1 Tax=Lytechinus variegatus TaxID=7654 RepID=UPI001BB1469A|nr:uncharacterized protein LOC121425284 [Lytechinus variegatus]
MGSVSNLVATFALTVLLVQHAQAASDSTATYLQSGKSYPIYIPRNYTRRFYHATALQTNDTNVFRVVFNEFSTSLTSQVQIGTGTDPSDEESVITTIYGYRGYVEDIYIEANEMWMAAIGGPAYTYLDVDANIVAFDLSSMFNCTMSNMSVSSDVLCDGVYHCDHYEDESACNYSMTYLQPGESYSFHISYNYISRSYHATLLQTNDTNGFRFVFQDFHIDNANQVQIGAGTDPSDLQSVITTIHGYRDYADDVYVETNEVWIAVIGTYDTFTEIYANIVAFDLSTLLNCTMSNMSVSSDVLCDGAYHCDHYEDESACNYSMTYLQPGESYSLYIPYNYISRSYHATLLQTNETNGFRIVFRYLNMLHGDGIQIGTGTDPSDPQSITTTIYGYRGYADDVYVETNEMWIAAIGGPGYTYFNLNANIFAFDATILCDGVYHCDRYEDESACNYSMTYLQPGESYSFYISYNYISRSYHATLLQTNDTNGFRIVFQYFYIGYSDKIQIGTGTDPSDLQSVITTINGSRYYTDDVYVVTNEMWIAAIGGPDYTYFYIIANIVAIDLSTLLNCTLSVSSDVLCDGVYHCDRYEDESACNTV